MELDEHEQGERVRKWLRQHGSSMITGISLGLALVFGWQWWQGKGERHKEEAAAQFLSFGKAIDAKDPAKAKVFSALLAEKYADTAYADLAVLRNAAHLQETGKTAEAIKTLQSGLPRVKQADLAEMFGLRIARLQLIAGKPDDAAKQLASINKPRYVAIANELRGDIAVAKGQREEARKAYQTALTALDQAAPTRNLLELKLIDAGGQPPAKPEI